MLFVFSVEVSFSLHSLKEIALDCKYRCPTSSLPASRHYSPEDLRKGVNLEGKEMEVQRLKLLSFIWQLCCCLLLMDLIFCLDFSTVPLSVLLDAHQDKEG